MEYLRFRHYLHRGNEQNPIRMMHYLLADLSGQDYETLLDRPAHEIKALEEEVDAQIINPQPVHPDPRGDWRLTLVEPIGGSLCLFIRCPTPRDTQVLGERRSQWRNWEALLIRLCQVQVTPGDDLVRRDLTPPEVRELRAADFHNALRLILQDRLGSLGI